MANYYESNRKDQYITIEKFTGVATPRYKGTYRYVLGAHKGNPLICIGYNPSTATLDSFGKDNTIRNVVKIAEKYGLDGFIMLNLYPYCETFSKKLPSVFDQAIIDKNKTEILKIISAYPSAPIVAAWGNLLKKDQTALLDELIEINKAVNAERWHCFGKNASESPRHPSRIGFNNVELCTFQMEEYLRSMLGSALR